MPDMNVTYQGMMDAARQIRNFENNILLELTNNQTQIANAVEQYFNTPQAMPAYQNAMQNFTSSAKQTAQSLEPLAQFLINAANALQQTDSDLARSIQQ